MIKREDPFDGELSVEDVQSLGKSGAQPPAPSPEQTTAEPKPIKQKDGVTMLGDPADNVVINPQEKPVNEANEKTATMAFGRFNPPTVGHEKLIHKVESVAKEHGSTAHIFASHSEGKSDNPLPQKAKLGYLNKVVSKGTKVHGSTKDEPSFLQAAAKLHAAGHQHLVMVAGSDRVDAYHNKLHQYNGTGEGKLYNFKSIKVVSAGQRDPDAPGVEGMSGTKLRAHARAGEMSKFKAGLPKALHPHATEIANHIKAIKEEIDLEQIDENVVGMTTRMHRSVNMKKNKAKLTRAREIARRRLAKNVALSRRTMKKAKNILRTRLAGDQGTNYTKLSASQKIAIDKMVERKKGAIKRIAAKIAPRVKGDELRRLQSVTTGNKYKTSRMVVSAAYQLIGDVITEKENRAIVEKAESSGINYQTLLQVFNRGKNAWNSNKPPGKTPSQYAFDRLNSYVAGGKAFKEDIDLREQSTRPTLRSIMSTGLRTPRNMDTVDPQDIMAAQPRAHHADNIKDTMDDSEVTKYRKRADIIRRKTTEYVRKVTEDRGVRDTVSPSLVESIEALSRSLFANSECVIEEDYIYEEWTEEQWNILLENDNEGRTLNKPFRTTGGPKKFAVYVKNDKGNIIKLGFGDPNLEIKRDDPDRRRAYRARHGCDNPGPKWKANWWSCNWSWSANKKVGA
jgi:hypothetical protein